MKKLFLTLVIVGLISCQQSKNKVQIMGLPQDANDLPFEIDSITNVSQLLDSLEAVSPKNL
jgi:hypothetical protein